MGLGKRFRQFKKRRDEEKRIFKEEFDKEFKKRRIVAIKKQAVAEARKRATTRTGMGAFGAIRGAGKAFQSVSQKVGPALSGELDFQTKAFDLESSAFGRPKRVKKRRRR